MSIHVHKIRKGEPTLPDNFDLDRSGTRASTSRMGERSVRGAADRAGGHAREDALRAGVD